MRSKIGGDRRCDNVVRSSHKKSHDSKHRKKKHRTQILRTLGKDGKENDEAPHESSDNNCTSSPKNIRNTSNNDTSGHHTERVKRRDQVGLDRFKILFKEVWQPEEKHVVGKLEKSECHCVLCNHRNLKRTNERDWLWSIVFKCFSVSERCTLFFLFGTTNADLFRDNSHICWIRNETDSNKSPKNVRNSREHKCPPVWKLDFQNEGSTESCGDVTKVLVACPETENKSTLLDTFCIGEPVTHDGCSDRSSSCLEKAEEEIYKQNENISIVLIESFKVENDCNGDEEQTSS
mmetsp:Transcript_9138/g.14183  ORF Transcript_9138/g.14183 Transcript_9138/m.14183 type:complete len:291 (+) Transcript_9138:340-1212(+)